MLEYGKIVELVQSSDGNVRSVKVKLHTGRVIGRPLKLLFPLEVSNNSEKELEGKKPNSVLTEPNTDQRPKRKAAVLAKTKIEKLV